MKLYGRRDFLKAAGLTLAAAASAGVLTACGDSGTPGGGGNTGNSSGSENTDKPSGGDSDSKDPDSGKGDSSEKPDVIDPSKIEWTCNAKGELTGCNTALTGTVTLPSYVGNTAITAIGSLFYESRLRGFRPTEMIVPDCITHLIAYSFRNFLTLQKVTLPETLLTINSYAFQNCIALTSITIPDSVWYIDSNVFYGCDSLRKVALPDHLTKINGQTFYYCNNLKAVYIPKSVETIDTQAFVQTKPYALDTIYYGGSKEDWDNLKANYRLNGNELLIDMDDSHFVYGATKKKFLDETANL